MENRIVIALYVNDMLIFGKSLADINNLKKDLNEEFKMTDLGDLTYFLGLHIIRDHKARTIFINQANYVDKILTQFNMQDCNPILTPLDPHVRISKSTDSEPHNLHLYQQAIGNLMYLMLGTRPDLAFAISTLSRFHLNPNETHWNYLKRVFRYLQGT